MKPTRITAPVALLLLTTVAAGPARAIPLFRAPAMIFDVGQDPANGANPYGDQGSSVAGDLTGDGRADVVVANINSAAGPRTGNTVSVLLSNGTSGSPSLFQAKMNYVVGRVPGIVGLVDMNNDSHLDVVTYNAGDSTITVLPGNGAGQFGARTDTYVGYGVAAIGDVNGDGKADAVLGSYGAGQVLAFIGTGTGGFTFGGASPVSLNPLHLVDLNGDGALDLVGHTVSQTVATSLGNGNGAFQAPVTAFTSPTDIWTVVGDFDSDMVADLAVAHVDGLGPVVQVLHGNGDGTFTPYSPFVLPDSDPFGIAAADLDLDGALDVVVSINLAASFTLGDGVNSLVAVFGGGNGEFGRPILCDGGGNFATPVIGDFDGDTVPDIAATNWLDFYPGMTGSHALSVLLSNFASEFGGGYHIPVTHDPHYEAIADVNRDGKPDLIVSAGEDQFDIHLGNGAGGFFPPILVPTTPAFAPGPFAVGDINRDGKLDIQPSTANVLYGVGDGTFTTGGPNNFSGRVVEESLVDLNGDGILDLITLPNTFVSVKFGTPSGTFGGGGYGISLPTSPRDLAVGDWNRDGNPDVAIAMLAGIQVMMGDSDGMLGSSLTLEPFRGFRDVTSGDFNRDGIPDLASRDEFISGSPSDAGGISIFYGTGNPFTPFGSRTPYAAFDRDGFQIKSWDVNRDGFPDLVASNHQPLDGSLGDSDFWSVSAWLGNAMGFVRDSDYLTGVGQGDPQMTVGDIDRDGQPDILGHNVDYLNDDSHKVDHLSVLRGNQPSFGPGLTHLADLMMGSDPIVVETGDLNRDGKLDLVALRGQPGSPTGVTVRFGQGNGMFVPAIIDSAPVSTSGMKLADLNQDGNLDLVLVAFERVEVALGNGTGAFGPRIVLDSAPSPPYYAVVVGDVNRDGNRDIIASTIGSDADLYLGNGDGTFQPASNFALPFSSPYALALADMNRDGLLDLISASPSAGAIAISMGDGGDFLPGTVYAHGLPVQLAVGDMNRDGIPDILVASAAPASGVYVRLGDIGGGLGPAVDFPTPAQPHCVALGDLDGNGILDALAVSGAGVSTWYGNGIGGLNARSDFSAPPGPVWLALGDFNRDSKLDAAAACTGADFVAIYLNGTFTPTAVEAEPVPPPAVTLGQNYPNPFNPVTTIRFATAREGETRLRVFDVRGRLVATLVDGVMPAGDHHVPWPGRDDAGHAVASGVYYYKLEMSGFVESRSMVLLK